MSTRGLLFQ